MDTNRDRNDAWTHRQAIQIVAQLPDDEDAALAVLERAKELLTCWRERAQKLSPIGESWVRPRPAIVQLR
jgi:hypothetical protein